MSKPIRPLGGLAVHEVLRVEIRALGSDPDLVVPRIEERDRANSTLVGQERSPERLTPDPNRTDDSHPGNVSRSLFTAVCHLAFRPLLRPAHNQARILAL